MFFSTREEREQHVIELYKQGKTIREIAQDVHMSFGSIGSIIRKLNGEEDNTEEGGEQQKVIHLSKETLAFKLFLDGKNCVEVVIALDIKPEEAETLYIEFLRLSGLDKLVTMYKEAGLNIQILLNLFRIITRRGMNEQDIMNLLNLAKEIPVLKEVYEQLVKDVDDLDHKKCNLIEELSFLQNEESKLRNALKWYESELKVKTKEISDSNLKER
jgi:hypothetical protein